MNDLVKSTKQDAEAFAIESFLTDPKSMYILSLAWIEKEFMPHVKNKTQITPEIANAIFWNYFYFQQCFELCEDMQQRIDIPFRYYSDLDFFMEYAQHILNNAPC